MDANSTTIEKSSGDEKSSKKYNDKTIDELLGDPTSRIATRPIVSFVTPSWPLPAIFYSRFFPRLQLPEAELLPKPLPLVHVAPWLHFWRNNSIDP